MSNSILTERCMARMITLNAQQQLQQLRQSLPIDEQIKLVDHLLAERRQRQQPVPIERRGRNPQRAGWESHDQDDIAAAFAADASFDKPQEAT